MQNTQWIMSEGGPLICMETTQMASWEGIDGASVASADAGNDYERASQGFDYLETLPLKEGQALIFGEGPLDTSVWTSDAGDLYMVRIFACEDDFDIDAIMRNLRAEIFENPLETLSFSFATPDIAIFDAAMPGSEAKSACIAFSIRPGDYQVITQPHDPDPLTSLVLHRFDPVSQHSR